MTTPLGRDYRLARWLAHLGLCLAYLYSGVAKLADFDSAIAEQVHFGLQPAALFAGATILVQLGGSALVLFARGPAAAIGALALAGFTVVATVIGHAFWTMTGADRFHNLNSFLEHIGLVGGFLLIALLALREGHSGYTAEVHDLRPH